MNKIAEQPARFADEAASQAAADEAGPTDVASGRTLVMVCTYNELENLPELVDGILEQAPDVDLLVVDDSSPDGTGDWAEAKSALESRLKCLHRDEKAGLGAATIAGMRWGLDAGYDFVLNMDADFSHHPRHLPAIRALAARADVDVVIGSRYVPGGEVVGWPAKRKFMSWGVNSYARTLLGLPIHDCSGAYRCYRASVLKQVDFSAIVSRGYSFQEEILWRLKRLGARFAETPITFEDRTRGESKINGREAVAALGILARCGVKNWLGL